MIDHLRSTVPGVAWPALPDAAGATALALQYQLDKTQWQCAADIERQQMAQLALLLAHANSTVPFWQQRLGDSGYDSRREITREWFSTLPLLSRAEVQAQAETLLSKSVPAAHGRVLSGKTSGSTGRPITFFSTELTQVFWRAFTLRDHLWQERDFSGKLASIRSGADDQVTQGWGPATDYAFNTGQLATLSIRTDIKNQLDWLEKERPNYLLSFASNLRELAGSALAGGIRLPGLREVRAIGEMLPVDLRDLCRAAWNVDVTDTYSSQELGYIALQCPRGDHYHVQAEGVFVEILNEDGAACAPGQIGRVVVTPLHNFAMPLIRYEIGDYAEAGDACECGRGLPVLRRIMGRTRNVMTLPDGSRRWPSFPSSRWAHLAPIKQLQLVQTAPDSVVLRVAAPRALTGPEQDALVSAMRTCLGYPFNMTFEWLTILPRSANDKFEEFISQINS